MRIQTPINAIRAYDKEVAKLENPKKHLLFVLGYLVFATVVVLVIANFIK